MSRQFLPGWALSSLSEEDFEDFWSQPHDFLQAASEEVPLPWEEQLIIDAYEACGLGREIRGILGVAA